MQRYFVSHWCERHRIGPWGALILSLLIVIALLAAIVAMCVLTWALTVSTACLVQDQP